MTKDSEIEDFLRRDDEESRPFRVERMRFLLQEWGEPRHLLLPSGLIAAPAFEESRLAYLHGEFIACVVLCQIVLEHVLAGTFVMAGRDDLERANFATLLSEALAEGLISQEEFAALNSLRERRNPYTHARSGAKRGTLMRRLLDEQAELYSLFEADARLAIAAMFRLLKRKPFGFTDD